ncbi:TRAP transporter small permease [Candidatus Foliamicus sp.]
MKDTAQRVLAFLSVVERAVAGAAFALLVAVIFGDVAIRVISGSGLYWARQIGVYANVIVVMFGIGLASAANSHLRPRFADGWLPKSWGPFLDHFSEVLMALFCLVFAVVAFDLVRSTYLLDVRSVVLRIIVWPIQGVIPLVFALATLRHALYARWPDLKPPERGALADTQAAKLDP